MSFGTCSSLASLQDCLNSFCVVTTGFGIHATITKVAKINGSFVILCLVILYDAWLLVERAERVFRIALSKKVENLSFFGYLPSFCLLSALFSSLPFSCTFGQLTSIETSIRHAQFSCSPLQLSNVPFRGLSRYTSGVKTVQLANQDNRTCIQLLFSSFGGRRKKYELQTRLELKLATEGFAH